jgi:hypothetical protein
VRSALTVGRDSIAYTNAQGFGLMHGDSLILRKLCFDNTTAASDTVRYTWTTYYKGVAIVSGVGSTICIRPLTGCDSVSVRTDSTSGATQRCIMLQLRNRNSRRVPITRFSAKILNPGTPRTVLSASAPAAWQVQKASGDSVVWIGGPIQPGGTLAPFTFCVPVSDPLSRDPLTIVWTTANGLGAICTDTTRVNVIIPVKCDSVQVRETGSSNQSVCCYSVAFTNRNEQNRLIDRFRLEIAGQQPVRFASGTAPAQWIVAPATFPSSSIEYTGAGVAPGEMTPDLRFCIDASQLSTRPLTIPVIWRTYAGSTLICSDTLRLTCTDMGSAVCDTVSLISSRDSAGVGCTYGFRVTNSHDPSEAVNGVRFRIIQGDGVIADAQGIGGAASWSPTNRQRSSVIFRGDSVATGSAAETFAIRIDSSNGNPITLEACTLNGDRVICCTTHLLQCSTSGVEISLAPTGFRLHANRPNPFNGITEIGYDLLRPATVRISVRNEAGAEVKRVEQGREDTGTHRLRLDCTDLPSGIYFYTLEAGGEKDTRRMVLAR